MDTKWAPDAALIAPVPLPEALALPCKGSITIICWEDGVVECAAGEGMEDEGRVKPLEEGGIVPIGYDRGFVWQIMCSVVIIRCFRIKSGRHGKVSRLSKGWWSKTNKTKKKREI